MIDSATSERYGIVPHGTHGMEVQEGGRQLAAFKAHRDQEANWLEAVAWAKENLE